VNPNIPTQPLTLTFRPFGPPISSDGDASHCSPYGYRDPVTLQARDVCLHCRREITHHRFTTPDDSTELVEVGVWLETHHCREHGDVAPMRSHVVNHSAVA
jgi:hypothetical protein